MIALAVLAGGRGTRLFGSGGGNKAMADVGFGKRLIDYVIIETRETGIDLIRAITPEDDILVKKRLQQLANGSRVECIHSTASNTGEAVVKLIDELPAEYIILTPCDIVGPKGALHAFFKQAMQAIGGINHNTPACAVAITNWDGKDDRPIFVHHDNCIVTQYSKEALPSGSISTGVRIMNRSFAKLFLDQYQYGFTDTMTMSSCVKQMPKSVLAFSASGIFDIDNQTALMRAKSLLQEPMS